MSDYKEKYLKYKQKYLNLKKQLGGDITVQELVSKSIEEQCYPYITLFKDWMIQNICINGVKCNGDINNINLLSRGSYGFAASFECSNQTKFTVKFVKENAQIYNSPFDREIADTYINDITSEFSKIIQFDSPVNE